MDIQQKQQDIEKELLAVIIQHLRNQQLDVSQASQLAKDFIQVLPLTSQEDLLVKLKTLGDTYPELKQLYDVEAAQGERAKEQQVIDQMGTAIKAGNIEDAISAAKSLQSQPIQ